MLLCNSGRAPASSASCFLIVFFLLSLFPFASTASADVVVFIYHRFGEAQYPTTNVDTERFREQMEFLQSEGYHVLPLSALVNSLKEKRPLPEKSVVITIDDGYASVYTEAWPILKSFGYPFTVFLYAKAVEKKYRNFITWEQAQEMHKAGVDIQDHSYSHSRFGSKNPGMSGMPEINEEEYRTWIREDFKRSRKIFLNRMGRLPQYLALPYGEYNSLVHEEVKSLGYDAILTQDPGPVSEATPLVSIPREPILGNEWASMHHFKMVLNRVDLPITDTIPESIPLKDSMPEKFSARLLHPERYRPGSFGIYVSELGWNQVKQEGDVISFKNNVPLKRRTNRVMVSAREKESGKTAVRFWLLIKDEN
ncbi:MAG: polysaccharide deacetylase family protein [Desulfobulbaceae bacterium]|nr:polysaccharide deacetylase family protein [Desulfobulbaceae bacterium]